MVQVVLLVIILMRQLKMQKNILNKELNILDYNVLLKINQLMEQEQVVIMLEQVKVL